MVSQIYAFVQTKQIFFIYAVFCKSILSGRRKGRKVEGRTDGREGVREGGRKEKRREEARKEGREKGRKDPSIPVCEDIGPQLCLV
jgi:hypothetical protein